VTSQASGAPRLRWRALSRGELGRVAQGGEVASAGEHAGKGGEGKAAVGDRLSKKSIEKGMTVMRMSAAIAAPITSPWVARPDDTAAARYIMMSWNFVLISSMPRSRASQSTPIALPRIVSALSVAGGGSTSARTGTSDPSLTSVSWPSRERM